MHINVHIYIDSNGTHVVMVYARIYIRAYNWYTRSHGTHVVMV